MLKTHIDNVSLDTCIMNASGLGSITLKDIEKLDQSFSGAVVSKTSTYKPCEGRPEPTYYFDSIGSVNSVGLKNRGYKYYINIETHKPYIFSTVPDKRIFEDPDIQKPDLIELNISCPNIASINTEEILRQISECTPRRFGVKLAPLTDVGELSDILNEFSLSFITCCNTLKNGLILKDSEFVLNQKFGGIGGQYLKPIALSNVYQFRQHLKAYIDIIGCGGISTGHDVIDYLACGATAVQVGTHFFNNDVNVFENIVNEIISFS